MARKKKMENPEVQENTTVVQEEQIQEEPAQVPNVEGRDGVIAQLSGALNQISLRQIALATGCTYNVLLKASKAPIEGQMYDPEAVNFIAVEKAMRRKLGDDLDKLDWETIIKEALENAPQRGEGGITIEAFEIDDYVKLREIKDAEGATIPQPVYQLKVRTGTHVVLVPVTEGFTIPRVMSYGTFIHQGAKKYDVNEATQVAQKVEEANV